MTENDVLMALIDLHVSAQDAADATAYAEALEALVRPRRISND